MPTPIIKVKNLTFRYDKRLEKEILANVSFTIDKGEWVAIVGHNGSGKSTLARILVGLLVPQSGLISIAGREWNNDSKWELRRHIGIVFQNPDNQFIGTTVQDDVAFCLENLNIPFDEMKIRIDEALKLVEMSAFREHDPSRLSGGQKQRVAMAGVLALKPDILVLDEALVMLDPRSRRELLASLQQLRTTQNLTIISITHDMSEAAAADRILMLREGHLEKCGPPQDMFQDEIEWEPPFAERLRRTLLKRNRSVPNYYMTEEEMVQWLWK